MLSSDKQTKHHDKPSKKPHSAPEKNHRAQNINTLRGQFAGASLSILAAQTKKKKLEKLKEKNRELISKAFREKKQLLFKRGHVTRLIKEFRPDGTVVIEDSEKGTLIMKAEQVEKTLAFKLLNDPGYYELKLVESQQPDSLSLSDLQAGDRIAYQVNRKGQKITHNLNIIKINSKGQAIAEHVSGGSGKSRLILISNFALVAGEPIICQPIKANGETSSKKLRLEAPQRFRVKHSRRAA